jgi:uncharacterized integral membrane protein
MYINLIIILIIAIIAVIFGVQNTAVVTINFLGLKFDSSLALVLLLSVLIGFVITILFSIPYFYKFKKIISTLKKENSVIIAERDEIKKRVEEYEKKDSLKNGEFEKKEETVKDSSVKPID